MSQPKPAKSAPSARKTGAATARPAAAAGAAARRRAGAENPPSAGDTDTPAFSAEAQAARDEALREHLAQLREVLAGGVMLTAGRVQDTMDDAVRRGKMTRRDAEELARGLLDTGRRQSFDILTEVEQLLERSRSDLESATNLVRGGTDRVLRKVEKVRRTAGGSATSPIAGYDELTAGEVLRRLPGLDPADLRRVRDQEQAGRARRTVLTAVDKALG